MGEVVGRNAELVLEECLSNFFKRLIAPTSGEWFFDALDTIGFKNGLGVI